MILYYRSTGSANSRKAKKVASDSGMEVETRNAKQISKEEIKNLLSLSNGIREIIIRNKVHEVKSMKVNEMIDYLYLNNNSMRMPQLIYKGRLITGYDEEMYDKIFKKR